MVLGVALVGPQPRRPFCWSMGLHSEVGLERSSRDSDIDCRLEFFGRVDIGNGPVSLVYRLGLEPFDELLDLLDVEVEFGNNPSNNVKDGDFDDHFRIHDLDLIVNR